MPFVANKVPEDLAGSGWYELLSPPAAPNVLQENISVDWVVIGGGFAGLSAAKRLNENGPSDRIVVLDAQRIGWGAAGRNSGFMIDLPHDLQSEDYSGGVDRDIQQIKLNRFAIDYAKSMIAEFGLEHCVDDHGKINAATDDRGIDALRAYSEHLTKLNESFEELNASALEEITGTNYYSGGIRTPGCLQVQPASYIRGVALGLENSRKTVEVYENSPVVSVDPGPVITIKTPKATVKCKGVIFAVNGHLESFGLFSKRLMHVFTYASMTRAMSEKELRSLGGRERWGVLPAHPMGTTVRKIKEGRVVIRNVFSYNKNRETTAKQVQRIGKKHDAAFIHRFPMLKDIEMEYRWGGHLCLSLNSAPAFGEIERGIFVAGCQNGLGAVRGTLNGVLIADMACGRKTSMLDDVVNQGSPSKLYPEPFMSIGAKANLWWNHLRAGRDL